MKWACSRLRTRNEEAVVLHSGGGSQGGFTRQRRAHLIVGDGDGVVDAFAGIGWQWKALEIVPELRGQLPLTEGDEPGMIVMGRFQVHTP